MKILVTPHCFLLQNGLRPVIAVRQVAGWARAKSKVIINNFTKEVCDV